MQRIQTVTAKLVCAFVFAYANCWFSDATAHFENVYMHIYNKIKNCKIDKRERDGLAVERRTPNREFLGSSPSWVRVLCICLFDLML